mmetsp:Transcript_17215/g.15094  ORF Transcript_17215/g.15094 Transcript_17215/m.15094 type:complete len:111 (+) Transcript_17215:70-402(+)
MDDSKSRDVSANDRSSQKDVDGSGSQRDVGGSQRGSQKDVSGDNQNGSASDEPEVKKIQTKFQSVSLREYYDSTNLTLVLTKGLEELGRQRPQNPIKFLGSFLLENDPEK